jgi:hypothetical protein
MYPPFLEREGGTRRNLCDLYIYFQRGAVQVEPSRQKQGNRSAQRCVPLCVAVLVKIC